MSEVVKLHRCRCTSHTTCLSLPHRVIRQSRSRFVMSGMRRSTALSAVGSSRCNPGEHQICFQAWRKGRNPNSITEPTPPQTPNSHPTCPLHGRFYPSSPSFPRAVSDTRNSGAGWSGREPGGKRDGQEGAGTAGRDGRTRRDGASGGGREERHDPCVLGFAGMPTVVRNVRPSVHSTPSSSHADAREMRIGLRSILSSVTTTVRCPIALS